MSTALVVDDDFVNLDDVVPVVDECRMVMSPIALDDLGILFLLCRIPSVMSLPSFVVGVDCTQS